jgi:hypothetical protein
LTFISDAQVEQAFCLDRLYGYNLPDLPESKVSMQHLSRA